MIYKFSKFRIRLPLILGSVFLLISIISLTQNNFEKWNDYFYLTFGLFYIGKFFYQKRYQYVEIEHDTLKINGPLGKKIPLTDIKQIKVFAGDFIFKTDEKDYSITTQIMDPDSVNELKEELDKLPVEWLGRKPKAA